MHQPVLLKEAIEALEIDSSGYYVDATFGRGGHTQAILAKLNADGRLMVIDSDPQAIEVAHKLAKADSRVFVFQGPFSLLENACEQLGWLGKVNGVLMDLGISSPQLDQPERGFSFLKSGPLDMRFDPNTGISASQWIAKATELELATVFKTYGQERFAKRIAKALVLARRKTAIETTTQLAQLIAEAVPKIEKHKHPATRCFQAIRIFLNQELSVLKNTLDQMTCVLAENARLVVISFHSLEDTLVKQFIQSQTQDLAAVDKIPIFKKDLPQKKFQKIGRPIRPGWPEILNNPRARSAILRIVKKGAA